MLAKADMQGRLISRPELPPSKALERISNDRNDFKSKHLNRPRPNASSSNNLRFSSLNVMPMYGRDSPEKHPRKRAVLCGVTYQSHRYRLKGTINDVRSMRDLLLYFFDYSPECIRVLTEEEEPAFHPTKKNIQESLKWLVEGSEAGDSLVFYFSGRGLRQLDFNGDDRDGLDETICPVDFRKEGVILDKDINSTIVRPLKRGVTLHAIVDACHSGTILDLEWVYKANTKKWEDNSPPSKAQKSTSGGMAICLNACVGDQMDADTSALTGENMVSAMTYTLIETVCRRHKSLTYGRSLTYGSLLEEMHDTLQKVNNGTLLKSRLLHRFFHRRIIQDLLLSSSEAFDVDKKEFIL